MAPLLLDAVMTVGKTLDGFAIFLSVADTNGKSVAGLAQKEFSIDTLAGNLNLSDTLLHFLEPKPGFYILTITPKTPLELNSSHVVSIVLVHLTSAGSTDNGQTLAAMRV